jgi:hypothetical protein
MFQAFSLSWGDAPRFDIAGLQPVGRGIEPERLKHYNLRRRFDIAGLQLVRKA